MTTNTEYKIDPQEIVQSFFDETSFKLFKSKMNSRFNKLSGEDREQLRMLTAELVGRAFYSISELRNLGWENQSICYRFATCLDFISGITREISKECESYQSKRASQVENFKSLDRDIKNVSITSIQKTIVITGTGGAAGYALGEYISMAAAKAGPLKKLAKTVHSTFEEKEATGKRYGQAERELEALKKKEVRKILYSKDSVDFKKHDQLYHKIEQTLAEHNTAKIAFRNSSVAADAAWKEYLDVYGCALDKKAGRMVGAIGGAVVAATLSKAVLGVFNCLFSDSCKAPGLPPEIPREQPFYSELPGPVSLPYPKEHLP